MNALVRAVSFAALVVIIALYTRTDRLPHPPACAFDYGANRCMDKQ